MITPFARYGLVLAVVCAVVVALSGPGYRLGWWPLPVAFMMLRWTTYVALFAGVLGIIGAIHARPGSNRRGFGIALLAIVIGLATSAGPLTLLARGKQAPPIHDITTDTDNPPQFVAVVPLRAAAKNPVEYGGAAIAAQQKQAFPQIAPVMLPLPPDQAFARALSAAHSMGWAIAASSASERRIEATDTTWFFGFKDDVVIRVSAAPSGTMGTIATTGTTGSRIDVRSLSRIGKSDLGKNAQRVEKYLKALQGAR